MPKRIFFFEVQSGQLYSSFGPISNRLKQKSHPSLPQPFAIGALLTHFLTLLYSVEPQKLQGRFLLSPRATGIEALVKTGACSWDGTEDPHDEQNFDPGAKVPPHWLQNMSFNDEISIWNYCPRKHSDTPVSHRPPTYNKRFNGGAVGRVRPYPLIG